MMTKVYDSSIFKKWEYLISNIITIGKKDDEEIFIRNFSLLTVIGYGTFFFQLIKGHAFCDYPEILKSILSISSLFVTLCYSKIIIFDHKKNKYKSITSNIDITYKNSFRIDELIIKKHKKSVSKNSIKDKILFEENLIIKIREIIENLKITETKQFAYLLFYIKEKMFLKETDTLIIEQFNDIFSVNISPQFFSQIKNEIQEIYSCKDFSRSKEKYFILYNDIIGSF